MMDDVRILKGWTKEERKELEEAKDGGLSSTMTLIYGIVVGIVDGDFHALSEKYYREDTNDNNQMAKDIVDFYCGNAKFSEQKYYVKLIKNDEVGYLSRNKLNTLLTLDGNRLFQNCQTEFTEQEIKDIDPRYMEFAVPVEADDE